MPSSSRPPKKTAARPTSKSRASPRRSGSKEPRPGAGRKKIEPDVQPRWQWRWSNLSNERKLDILGAFLALLGLLTLLSLLSPTNAGPVKAWVNTLYWLAGWGTFALPLALLAVGLWLVFRNIERLPLLSPERLIGVILLYLNILTGLHLAAGGGWKLVNAGQGGGALGGLFEYLLIYLVGSAGAWVLLIGWFLISLMFTLDLSIIEMLRRTRAMLAKLLDWLLQKRDGISRDGEKPTAISSGEALPAGFRPLSASARPAASGRRPAAEPSSDQPPLPSEEPSLETNHDSAPVESLLPAAPPIEWKLPSVDDILDPSEPAAQRASDELSRIRIIEETLAQLSTPAHVVEVRRGPTVTQFGVEPDFIEGRAGRTRVRVGKIVALQNDLKLALAASSIRIQAPVPGHNYVGIEVPNEEFTRVTLRQVMESEAFKGIKTPLAIALGEDVAGQPKAVDLAAMPHLLIAGTTGSGKSVCINAILTCFLLNNTPTDLRLVLVDPKRVELTGYNRIPHLLSPVIVEADRVVNALQWLMREMDSRYQKFARAGVRNIAEFNQRQPEAKLPSLVAVIDELSDLMIQAPDETERCIARLAQLARATGIHLILATQRPSVNVVTGLIKANFPARIAFAVAQGVDSRVILDQPGAESLLGRGDMLFMAPDASGLIRLQGVFVAEGEIQRLVDYWRLQGAEAASRRLESGSGTVEFLPTGIPLKQVPLWDNITEKEGDPLLSEAIDLVRREGRASITMLQRVMRIGYTRAARLIDTMETKGIVSPPLPNTQVREVLDYGPAAPPKED